MNSAPLSSSHRQRRPASTGAPFTTTIPAINDHDNKALQQQQQTQRRRRRKRQVRHRTATGIFSDRTLVCVGITLGLLILILGTVLVELIWTTKGKLTWNKTFVNWFRTTSTTTNDAWNPELNFQKKVWRFPRNTTTTTTTTTTHNPILVVGLPKAGTSSLFAYFTCLGFYSQHWYCCGLQQNAQQPGEAYLSDCMISNLQDGLPILDGCGDYDVYTELNGPRRKTKADEMAVAGDGFMGYRPRIFLPQHFFLEELHAHAPNATWIFNIRPLQDWIASVSKIPANMLTKQLLYEAQSQNPKRWPSAAAIGGGYRPNEAFLQEFWQEHVKVVQDFVAQHPSHALIWVNITNPVAGIQLARDLQAVGVTVPLLSSLQAARHRRRQQGNENSSSSLANQSDEETLYRRAKACWGAHNVDQHGSL